MADEKNDRQRAPVTPDETISDILLILDEKEHRLEAVSKIEKNGKHTTVPADEKHQNDFLHVDPTSSIVENFFKNFWNQLKDPTNFKLFSLRNTELNKPENQKAIRDLANGKQSDEVKDFLKKYEVRPKRDAEQKNINQKDSTKMATTEQKQNEAAEQPKYRFNESMINWEQLKAFGLSKEFLQEKGLLDQMLRGYKTNQLVPINMNFGHAVLRAEARLSLQQSIGGPVVLGIHGVRQKPELDRPFFGHIFSEEDKKNLRETGNMGRVVELKNRNGEYIPSFISIDKLTNEITAMKAENAFIPDEIKGVVLDEHEKNELREGRAIYVEGMKANSGNDFNAHIQINADRRGIEYIFENDKLYNRHSIGGVELTQKQLNDLNEGKAIFVEDMKRKDGELFSSFVKLDEATGRPSYTRYNPDSPEDAREIYVPKEINAVKLTGEDREALREGKPIFLENMVNRRGEEYSSFVKLDMQTGRVMYSKTPDGFEARAEFKVPAELWGVALTATQRAQLQDGKAVKIEGMVGYDGKVFDQYAKVNFNQGKINYYNENPDQKRDASQRNVVAEAQKNAAQKEQKKSRGKGITN